MNRFLGDYVEAVEATIGVRLPSEYLARGRTTGLVENGEVVGGFTVIARPPFRSLLQLPDRERANIEQALQRAGGRVVEANGLFLKRSVSDPEVIVSFWRALVAELNWADASSVVLSHSAESAKLQRLYAPLRAVTLYSGPVRRLEGMAAPDVERVLLTTVSAIENVTCSQQWLSARIEARSGAPK